MILEVAVLDVKPGEARDFEDAFSGAKPLIAATPGFLGLELRRCIERSDRHLLLVKWETLEAHTQGFRGSDRYAEWKRLLHRFYDPFPIVEHYGVAIAEA